MGSLFKFGELCVEKLREFVVGVAEHCQQIAISLELEAIDFSRGFNAFVVKTIHFLEIYPQIRVFTQQNIDLIFQISINIV